MKQKIFCKKRGMDMDNSLEKLEKYYSIEHEKKIFCTKLCVEGKCFDILYDYDKKDEIDRFVSNFSEYLPYYVYSADTLECIDPEEEISTKLKEISKKCWNGPTVPSRDKKVNGIFGEVFLDFYERIVKKAKLACTYASRRDFNSNNENRGFDNVLFSINNDSVEFVFAESKFVTDKASASTALVKDIKGETASGDRKAVIGHLTKEYMNDYITFVVEKNSYFSDADKELLKPFIKNLNEVLINQDGKFVDFLIEKNVHVNCVFFAIFKSRSVNPADYIDAYDAIYSEAAVHLKAIGFKNYSIEIVFIPTRSESMQIKGAIDEYYK